MSEDCVFCRIVAGEIPCDRVYEDEEILAFRDVNPQAPVHILIIPRTHISSLNDCPEQHYSLLGKMVLKAVELAAREGIKENGYRLAINCGSQGGQVVPHLHLHLLGGKKLSDRIG